MIKGFEVNAACSHAPSFVRLAIATNCNQSTTIARQSPGHFQPSGDPPPSRSYIPPAVSGSMSFFFQRGAHQLPDPDIDNRVQLPKHSRRAQEGIKKAAPDLVTGYRYITNISTRLTLKMHNFKIAIGAIEYYGSPYKPNRHLGIAVPKLDLYE